MRWSRVVKRGSAWPLQSNICPSEGLVRQHMGFQTTHNGPIGQCFRFRHNWPILGPLGPPLGAPKRPLHEQVKPFWKPKIHVPGPNCIVPVVTTLTEHSGPNLVTLGHTINFS